MRHRNLSKLALLGVTTLSLFALINTVVPLAKVLIFLNSISLGVLGALMVVFFPLLWQALMGRDMNRVSRMIIGFTCLVASAVGARLASLYINLHGNAALIASSGLVAFLACLVIVGGALCISAPGDTDEPGKTGWQYNKGTFYIGIAVGVVVAIASLLIQN